MQIIDEQYEQLFWDALIKVSSKKRKNLTEEDVEFFNEIFAFINTSFKKNRMATYVYPKTIDGEYILPGMRIFWKSNSPRTSIEGVIVDSVTIFKDEETGNYDWSGEFVDPDGGLMNIPDDFPLYADNKNIE